MSTFSVSGLASGLDTKTIISQLMSIDSQPQTKLKWNQQLEQARQSAWNDMKTKIGAMSTAANALIAPTAWVPSLTSGTKAWAATSGDTAHLNATVTGTPTAGSHTIQVYQLAQGQLSASTGSIGAGLAAADTLSITQGGSTWNVALAAGDKMTDIAAKINGTAGVGVFAYVDGNGALRMTSKGTGAASAFSVSSAGATAAQLGMTQSQAATDAQFMVDGVANSSASNSGITSAIPGVTLNLTGTTSTTLDIAQTIDGKSQQQAWEDSIVTKVKAFVDAYNATLDYVDQRTQQESKVTTPADPSTGITLQEYLQGPMARNFDMQNVATQLKSALGDTVSGLPAGSSMLTDIGITSTYAIGASGAQNKLSVDEGKLRAALEANPTCVQNILGQVGAGAGVTPDDGLVRRVSELATSMTSPTGIIGGALSSETTKLKNLQNSIDSMQRTLDLKQKYYEKMFSDLEGSLSSLQSQNSWLTSQIDAKNNSQR